MEIFSREELQVLTQDRKGPCVSIFLPTHRAGRQIRQDPIRFKNLLTRSEEKLTARGLRSAEAKDLLSSATQLITDGNFWRYQSDGLAVFISPDFFRFYRVPVTFGDLTVVGERFYIKPLLPLLTDGRFFVLALNLNGVRLFQGSRFSLTEIELKNIPRNIVEAVGVEAEHYVQFNTRIAQTGSRTAAYYGMGGGEPDFTKDVRHYFQKVDRGLNQLLRGEQAPLVLAGVEYELPLYRQANTYKNIISGAINVSPEEPEELHRNAWALVEPVFLKGEAAAEARYREFQGTGHASADLRLIVPAACHGLIETLFVAINAQRWGRFDPDTGAVVENDQQENGNEDLLNLAVIQTVLHRGAVYALPQERVPGQAACSAVFRY